MIFRRIIAALAIACAFASPALAQKTKAQLSTEIGTTFPDNSGGQITPLGVRTYESDVINSIMPTAPVVGGNLACFNGTTGLLQDCGSSPSTVPLTVGTTPINSGSTASVLYDNGGKIGEYAITGLGSVVMSTTPAIGSPTITGSVGGNATYVSPVFSGTVTGNNTIPLSVLQNGAGTDFAIGYWGSTTASSLAVNNCSNALTYSTSTHTFGCNALAGTGTVTTPGAGLVSSITANCSQAANQSTFYLAFCINAQVGTSYTFVDGDRAKLVTGTNASAQAYSLPQAGTATSFMAGWFVMVENRGTGLLTITPTTSNIDGAASISLAQNQGVKIVSDGTNYFTVRGMPALSSTTNSIGADVLLNNTANYFDGPSAAQGTSGTWLATGTVTLTDTAGSALFKCKLWDGTTVVASSDNQTNAASGIVSVSLSGIMSAPAANIRISCNDSTSTSGKIYANVSGNGKDSTINVVRIQ